jgi:hypothetical protein
MACKEADATFVRQAPQLLKIVSKRDDRLDRFGQAPGTQP